MITLITKLNKSALRMEVIEKPGTRESVTNKSKILITTVKRPRVRTVMGRVRSTKIGFTIVLSTARTIATTKAVTKESTETPGTRYAATRTTSAFRRRFKSIDITSSMIPKIVLKMYPTIQAYFLGGKRLVYLSNSSFKDVVSP